MTDESQVILTKALRSEGYSITNPRLSVLKALHGREPVTMSELTRLTEKDLDRASLYRTVQLFEKLGIIQKLQVGWKYKLELSDKFNHHHHHLTCINCGKIVSINELELETFIKRSALAKNFKTTDHQIEIQGFCSACVA